MVDDLITTIRTGKLLYNAENDSYYCNNADYYVEFQDREQIVFDYYLRLNATVNPKVRSLTWLRIWSTKGGIICNKSLPKYVARSKAIIVLQEEKERCEHE